MATDTHAEPVFAGRFRLAYLLVKTLACYAGVFWLCYFWPLFLNALLGDKSQPFGIFAGAVLLPLGFLILGGAFGKRAVLAHVLLTVIAVVATYAMAARLPGADLNEKAEALLGVWIWTSVVLYAAGFGFGVRAQLARHSPVAERPGRCARRSVP